LLSTPTRYNFDLMGALVSDAVVKNRWRVDSAHHVSKAEKYSTPGSTANYAKHLDM